MTHSQSSKDNCRRPEESPAERDEGQDKNECVFVCVFVVCVVLSIGLKKQVRGEIGKTQEAVSSQTKEK